MINLISPEQKTQLRKFYLKRLASVYMTFLFLLIISSAIFLTPAYIIFTTQTKVANGELEALKARPIYKEIGQTIEAVENANEKIQVISESTDLPMPLSAAIDLIVAHKNSDVIFTSITIDPLRSIQLKGIANDRTALTDIIKSFEDDEYFADVSSPISNIIKKEDIDFNISMKISDTLKNEQ